MMQALKTLTEENPSQLSPDFHKQLFKQDKDFYLNWFFFKSYFSWMTQCLFVVLSEGLCTWGVIIVTGKSGQDSSICYPLQYLYKGHTGRLLFPHTKITM